MERICCISINHKNAPVDIRERIRVEPADLQAIFTQDSEACPLNTCNRTEVYFSAMEKGAIFQLLEHLSGVDRPTIEQVSEYLIGPEAVRHLFMVASGLDSLVLGEPQILGQLKDAYRQALSINTTDTIMNKALHRAFRTAKRIRTETSIGAYPVSVASEAVELAGHIFGDISDSTVLIVGAGDMAGIAAKRLKDRGVKQLRIINRTHTAACELAHDLGGVAIPFGQLSVELAASDIVITSTGSMRPIITRDMVASAMKARKNRPIIIIDIAVPRDVEEAAGKCYNCYLYDIDALKAIVDKHFAHRETEAKRALGIIDEEVDKFEKWLDSLSAQSTIKDLFNLMDSHIADQLDGLSIPEGEKSVVENTLRASYKRLLHRPVSFLKEHPEIKYIENVRRIFQLDEDFSDRHKG
jgi:glutamyl-tRNA reductase